mgnify:CR=1 FL=1
MRTSSGSYTGSARPAPVLPLAPAPAVPPRLAHLAPPGRAARRDAEEQYRVELEEIRSDGVASHPTKYGQQKVNKALTGPVPVSVGPAPNAASLYPVIDDAPTGQ